MKEVVFPCCNLLYALFLCPGGTTYGAERYVVSFPEAHVNTAHLPVHSRNGVSSSRGTMLFIPVNKAMLTIRNHYRTAVPNARIHRKEEKRN